MNKSKIIKRTTFKPLLTSNSAHDKCITQNQRGTGTKEAQFFCYMNNIECYKTNHMSKFEVSMPEKQGGICRSVTYHSLVLQQNNARPHAIRRQSILFWTYNGVT